MFISKISYYYKLSHYNCKKVTAVSPRFNKFKKHYQTVEKSELNKNKVAKDRMKKVSPHNFNCEKLRKLVHVYL